MTAINAAGRFDHIAEIYALRLGQETEKMWKKKKKGKYKEKGQMEVRKAKNIHKKVKNTQVKIVCA